MVFNANRCAISFERETLEYKIASANKELFNEQINIAKRLLATKNNTTWKNMVEDKILKELCWKNITSISIANALCVTQRKMQRNLYLENTNFKDIFDRIRKRKAKIMILQKQFSIIEISEMLGYNDSTSFHRAYKRWYDHSPRYKHDNTS